MELPIVYLKSYYQLKYRLDTMNERDKISLLVIIVSVLLILWFFAIYYPKHQVIKNIKQNIQELKTQTTVIEQKRETIQKLSASPDTEKLIKYFHQLTLEMNQLDANLMRYSIPYISTRDLAELVHAMLKQTFGLTIVDFATVPQPLSPPPTASGQTTAQSAPAVPSLSMTPIHYRLILKGPYFSIMNYLKRLERLSWRLYWDKFDYSVKNYPEGIAVIEFYTLKPQPAGKNNQAGGS